MIVLGVIIAVIAVGFAVGILLGNRAVGPLEFYGLHLGDVSGVGFYLAGAATLLVLIAGVWLAVRGVRRFARTRREVGATPERAIDASPQRTTRTADGADDARDAESAAGRHAKDATQEPQDPMQPHLDDG